MTVVELQTADRSMYVFTLYFIVTGNYFMISCIIYLSNCNPFELVQFNLSKYP